MYKEVQFRAEGGGSCLWSGVRVWNLFPRRQEADVELWRVDVLALLG